MNSAQGLYLNATTNSKAPKLMYYQSAVGWRDSYISNNHGGFTKAQENLLGWSRRNSYERPAREKYNSGSPEGRIPNYRPDGSGRDTYVTH